MGKKPAQKQRKQRRRDLADKGVGKGGLSIGTFIQAKQQDPTFRRERKRKAFIRDAKIVNKYKRLLKHEGLQAKESGARSAKVKRGRKADRFFKGKMQARAEKLTQTQRDEEIERQLTIKKQRQKQRIRETRNLRQRTKTGQPLMKYSMQKLLGQIQRNAAR